MKFSAALEALVDIFVCGACGCSVSEASFDEATEALSEFCDQDAVASTTALKSVFLEVDVPDLKPVSGHTHGVSAAARSTASHLVDRIGLVSGLTPVFVQGSAADVRLGRRVTRSYYWAKDFMAAPARAINGDSYAMIDVDYYVDMNRRLSVHFRPHFLYTIVPNGVCKDVGEYKYTFDEGNQLIYDVSGGGHYEHELWDWSGDSVVARHRNCLGIIDTVAYYAIERRRVDDDHQLILLAPLKRYQGIVTSWFAERLISCRALERLRVVQGDFSVLRINGEDEITVCTGKPLCYTQCRIPARVDDAIASAARTVTRDLTLATVKSKMADGMEITTGDTRKYPGCEILLERHLQGTNNWTAVVSGAVRRFQWVPKGTSVDDDATPGMVAFMEPLLDGAFVPDKCRGNDQRAADERVTKLRVPDLEVDSFTSTCMSEFVTLLLGRFAGTLTPVENCVVYDHQNKPVQRRILDEAQHGMSNDKAANFVKREAYQSVNDPRMISQINGVDKMGYSAFLYAFTDIIKLQPWYAFSKTPREVAERVASICESAKYVDNTDFSRMDGRVGNVAREFERRVMFAAFASQYHLVLHELMRRQYCLRGVMSSGVRYDTGLARSSGSPETSAFNTMLNAFIMYLSYRRALDEFGAFNTPTKSWNMLGIYGGDDGLSAGLDMKVAELSARAVGQKLELVRVHRGEIGVSFLARRYGPDVWFGDLNSCCDIARQISKFHVTVHLPGNITQADKLREKAFAFSLTDSNTPVIGPFVRKVLKSYPLHASDFKNLLGIWRVELSVANQYPNQFSDWMLDSLMSQVPDFDHKLFTTWISSTSGEGLMHPPTFATPPAPQPKPGLVIIDGDLVGTVNEEKEPETLEEKRRRYRARKPKDERPSRKAKLAGKK